MDLFLAYNFILVFPENDEKSDVPFHFSGRRLSILHIYVTKDVAIIEFSHLIVDHVLLLIHYSTKLSGRCSITRSFNQIALLAYWHIIKVKSITLILNNVPRADLPQKCHQ